MSNLKVGGEVDGYCTRCRLTLAHTILALVDGKIARVRCNTCGGDHAHRAEASTSPSARSGARTQARRPEPTERVVLGFAEQLALRDVSKARPYNIKESFSLDDLVNHPTFGLGIVTAVRGDKMEVAFKADTRTLVQGRGQGVSSKPAYAPPAPPSLGPADKPQP